jgi:hypothetical protein
MGGKTHGHCPTINGKVQLSPTYHSWNSMKLRCKDKSRPSYGGKGVKICDRWLGETGFENFLADMGERPKGKTLGRKKNNKGYFPSNCQWETKPEQYRNQTSNHYVEVFGEKLTLAEACRKHGKVGINTIRMRVHKGWDILQALTRPVRHHQPGSVMSLWQRCQRNGINYSTVNGRIARGWSIEQALSTPSKG